MGADGQPQVLTQEGAKPVRQDDILNGPSPHFGRGAFVMTCVHFLPTWLHDGYLWLDSKYPIDVETMPWVTGLLIREEETMKVLKTKDASHDDIYGKYATRRGTRDVVILEINDCWVHFATQLLVCKLLRKCRKDECLLGVVVAIECCVGGV